LWWIDDDPRLSGRVREIIRSADNEVVFSAASAWEIALKSQLGHAEFPVELAQLVAEQVVANGFTGLAIEIRHALYVAKLPRIHRDPFDRILIAQSLVDEMPLLTNDLAIARYDVVSIW
jgi:PIN domain nuclease of toxin-antitoxin system